MDELADELLKVVISKHHFFKPDCAHVGLYPQVGQVEQFSIFFLGGGVSIGLNMQMWTDDMLSFVDVTDN